MPKFFGECPACGKLVVQSPACSRSYFCLHCRIIYAEMGDVCEVCDCRIDCITKVPITIRYSVVPGLDGRV